MATDQKTVFPAELTPMEPPASTSTDRALQRGEDACRAARVALDALHEAMRPDMVVVPKAELTELREAAECCINYFHARNAWRKCIGGPQTMKLERAERDVAEIGRKLEGES